MIENENAHTGTPPKNLGGRPCVYETKIAPRLAEIGEMFTQGFSRKAVADVLGVSVETFRKYERTVPELQDKITLSKAHSTAILVNALFELAKGATVETTKTKTYDDGRTVVEKIVETLPPNLAAIERLLNRIESLDANSPAAIEDEERRERERERVAGLSEADYRAFRTAQDRRDLML